MCSDFLPLIVNVWNLNRRRFFIYKAELNVRKFIEEKNQTSCEFESVRDTSSRLSKYRLLLIVNNLSKYIIYTYHELVTTGTRKSR